MEEMIPPSLRSSKGAAVGEVEEIILVTVRFLLS